MDKEILKYQFFIPKRLKDAMPAPSTSDYAPSPPSMTTALARQLTKRVYQFFRSYIGIGVTYLLSHIIVAARSFDDHWAWISQFLALIDGESRFNPSASNRTIVKYEGRDVKSHAYGLLQHTEGNWVANINRFNKAFPNGNQLLSGVFGAASQLKSALLSPPNSLSLVLADISQIKPLLGQTMLVKNMIDRDFMFTENGWVPSDSSTGRKIASSRVWTQFLDKASPFIKDKLEGRMALICLISANGSGFYNASKLYHGDTYGRYVAAFKEIYASAPLRQAAKNIINSGMSMGDPSKGYVISSYFGPRLTPYKGFHNGIDIPKPEGTPIYSPINGTVLNTSGSASTPGGYTIRLIKDTNEYIGFAHLKERSPLSAGDAVRIGDFLGYVGSTGAVSTGPHLHLSFKMRKSGPFLDPLKYIDHLIPAIWAPEFTDQIGRRDIDVV